MIAIMNYGIGNLFSVKNALDYLGYESVITSDKDEILKADKVILPGVGAFEDAINTFKKYGFDEVLNELIKKNTRNYAKRQITFFKHQFKCINISSLDDILISIK